MGALGGLNASSGPTAPTLCPGSRGHSSRLELRSAARIPFAYRHSARFHRQSGHSDCHRVAVPRISEPAAPRFRAFICKSLSEFSRSSATVFSDLWRSMLLERAARSHSTSSTSRIDRSQHAGPDRSQQLSSIKWKKAARGGLTECVGNERRDQAKNAYP